LNIPFDAITSLGGDKMLCTRLEQNGREISVMPEAHLISAGIAWFMELQEQGGPLCGHS
jgi:hypothetical protein